MTCLSIKNLQQSPSHIRQRCVPVLLTFLQLRTSRYSTRKVKINVLCKFEVILTVHRRYYVEIKRQLHATDDIYCRFYCMLNMFRAILCPSSGAREYYTDGRCLWYLVLWFSGCRYGVELEVMCPVCSSTPYLQPENQSTKYHRQPPSV